MDYPKFKISNRQADLAGKTLIDDDATPNEKVDALEILENWRANHLYPTSYFADAARKLLDEFAEETDRRGILVNRLKRLPSIYGKLARFPEMKLSRMQDVGGLRAIFSTVDDVYAFERRLVDSNLRTLKRRYDYIERPKTSGYRSLHLVYEFSDETRPSEYRGVAVEFQLRDAAQHYWATTLETFGVFMGRSLKEGGGPQVENRFFATASACLATAQGLPRNEEFAEKTPRELALDLDELERSLGVFKKLASYRDALAFVRREKTVVGEYALLRLNAERTEIAVRFFPRERLDEARSLYSELERGGANGSDVVLAATSSMEELLEAYPNYFANTTEFVGLTTRFMLENLPPVERAAREASNDV